MLRREGATLSLLALWLALPIVALSCSRAHVRDPLPGRRDPCALPVGRAPE